MAIRITEIFNSLQGESATVGYPTVFVRLTGCPMRCSYCDTAYAFHGGNKMEIDEIVSEVAQYASRHITVTGGEPLAQPECWPLLKRLCDLGYQVSLETGGAVSIAGVDDRVYVVLDIKTPASQEEAKNKYENLELIKPSDCLKFVICNREDYLWAKQFIAERQLDERCEIFFSPSAEELEPADLAEWILEDRLKVRFQIQLHKVLWHDARGK